MRRVRASRLGGIQRPIHAWTPVSCGRRPDIVRPDRIAGDEQARRCLAQPEIEERAPYSDGIFVGDTVSPVQKPMLPPVLRVLTDPLQNAVGPI